MIVPYALRLLCLCLASFFVVNAAAGLAAGLASRAIIRMAKTMRPRSAVHFLFGIRVLPCVLGAGAVLFFCIPSYLWFEPQASSSASDGLASRLRSWEQQAGLAPSRESARPRRFRSLPPRVARCRQRDSARGILDGCNRQQRRTAPCAGRLFRPRLIISDALLRSLSLEELQVALLHENAHRDSRDNLKRLVLFLAPAPIPIFRVFSALEQSWAKLSEWAADDEAVRGDSQRALSLATALLRVARMMGTAPCLSFLHTSLCAGDHDLSARVDRLLALQSPPAKTLSRTRTVAIGSTLGTAACIVLFLTWPATLSSVHRLLELFLR